MKQAPTLPREPAAEECCGEGCTPCVFDVYAEALERYKAEVEAFRRAPEAGGPAKARPRRRS
ncbi:MAG TPA: oxidoreductase-like domain-containing protein [Burkholderiales bacterium]|nr:oxidoreductase-like domain-containing protein [Burkholderiales bacterium]